MAGLILKNIEKTYGNNAPVVKNFNIDVKDKEFIVLVGPSGCGKSTLLRMIAGIESITKGELYIGNKLVNSVSPKDRNIAMVFQNYALYPHKSVYKNLSFALELRKLPKNEIEKKVNETAEILDIKHLLDRKPKELSGGQRQRVALGRAMVRHPSVFLFDEPLSNLDAKLRTTMRTEILKLHIKLDTTFIYVTHDQTEAMTMGDRIVVMRDGAIQQIDTPQNIYNYPRNIFVAEFIGSPKMNLIEGVFIQDSSGFLFKIGTHIIRLEENIVNCFNLLPYTNEKVIMGIRPEGILRTPANSANSVPAKIELVENMGAESFVHLFSMNNMLISRFLSSELSGLPGKINICFDLEKIHFFDKNTEESLKK